MPNITVAGQVHMIAWEGKRVSLWENVHSNGKDYSRLWTCWFDSPQLAQEEDWIEVTGELSTKIGEYTPKGSTETKRVVEHHVQGAVVRQHRTKEQQLAAENTPVELLDEMPF